MKKKFELKDIYARKLEMLAERNNRIKEFQNSGKHPDPIKREKSFDMTNLIESFYDLESNS
jgi:hypothetical protein